MAIFFGIIWFFCIICLGIFQIAAIGAGLTDWLDLHWAISSVI